MAYGIKIEVWGEYASFNRPEMKVERVSYEFITPGAARGILEAIYWKPQMKWVVDKIYVLAPIRFTQVRRNELDQKIPKRKVEQCWIHGRGKLGIFIENHRQQRASRILKDVRYGIEAHVEVFSSERETVEIFNHPEAKHLESFKRRARKGQYFHHPYLGCREFPAHFRLLEDDETFSTPPDELLGKRNFGFILWDVVFIPDPQGPIVEANKGIQVRAQSRFFEAVMEDGVVRVPKIQETRG